MKRRSIVALSAVAGTAIVAMLASSFRGHAPVAAQGAGSAIAEHAAAPASAFGDALPRAVAIAGQRASYDTDFSETVTLAAGAAPAANAGQLAPPNAPAPQDDIALVRRMRASWSLVCIAVEGDRVRYRATLSGTSLWVNGALQRHDAHNDFARPFFFETTLEGRFTSIAFDAATGADTRGVLKALVAASQLVMSKNDAADAWTTEEQDPTGEYEARYTRDGARHVRKARTRYLRIATDTGLRDLGEVGQVTINDDTKLELAADGKLRVLTSSTDTDMNLGEGMPRARALSTLAMQLARSSVDSAGIAAMNDEWSRLRTLAVASPPGQDDPITKESMQREADEGVLKKATLVDLQRDLATTPPSSSRARAVQMARFQSDFRLHPEDTQKAVRYVRTASVADGQAITGALGGANTPAALKALTEIADSRDTPPEVRVNAIGALAINGTPSAPTVQALQVMTGDADVDIRSASTLALGGAARTLGAADPATYESAIGALVRGVGSAQSAQAKVLYLRALGNAGDPRVIALAQDAMSDESTDVRIAAVVSVRFVASDLADQLLQRAMQKDTDAAVRVQAIATAESYRRVPGYLATFAAVMQNEAEALVRRAVIQALNGVRTVPEALALLTAAAESDASEDNRAMARAIVEAATAVSQN